MLVEGGKNGGEVDRLDVEGPLADLHLLPLEPAVGGFVAELDPAEAHIAGLSNVIPPDAQF